ncbi:hypothetical protein [Blastococcus sp. URHD0036]|uniref:hypothetical protein n=1 Tax=Blastococcus sp. URHD0036 TaxID=1380356 RepID=UPI00068E252B|nr:hypothetical protein [Blastococcus sp. URHD0036]
MNSHTDRTALESAASLLNAVGADRDRVPAGIALDCLYAAELLELAGAHTRAVELEDADPRHRIRTALDALATLSAGRPSLSEVAEAAQVARDALARLG